MRKVFIILMSVIVAMMGITSCKCTHDEPVTEKAEIVVENIISMDREYMFLNYGGDYRWFETCIVLENYLDADTTNTVHGISNVFQVVKEEEKSADVTVISIAHVADTSAVDVREHAFWVGDVVLNKEAIKLTFKDAFNRLMETNIPKPHSRYCVLREEVGAKEINPQYIFGNDQYQVYVDAVTGNVTDVNPAF